jgi:hypothetical protein
VYIAHGGLAVCGLLMGEGCLYKQATPVVFAPDGFCKYVKKVYGKEL